MTAPDHPLNTERCAPSLATNVVTDLATDLTLSAEMDTTAVGQSLRRLREARGWSAADVSQRLKFSERQIEALEAEQWAKLPQGLALRGLVRNYASMLDTDPQALLAALEPHLGAMNAGLARGSEVPTSIRAAEPPPRQWGLGLTLLVVLIVTLVGVAVALGLPSAWFGRQT